MSQGKNNGCHIILTTRCFVRRSDGLFLLVRRSPCDRRNPGKWEVPGGKTEFGRTLWESLCDEVMQETGLIVQETMPVVLPLSSIIPGGSRRGLTYASLFWITEIRGGNLVLSEEHTESTWERASEMLMYDLTKETREAVLALSPYLN
jgi:8-oxo-dGTP diphosphatase